ncbi:peroxisomal multifunctional enzyme type 2 [Ctenocephalides felis]|uniref:peroxisomal multifunctional enzyme type 2 n=1 Tax=Ctenocephalides felis TaxID=7515 RepID=UPI000E6E18EF|nr:peroxisomal multifunctional enzyme type 2 [Ctenocephalides felis]
MSKGGELRFDGRVAVVTGAGAGLGRCYALLLASRGAKVVVNDLGGGRHGEAGDTANRPADLVVKEIRDAGGEAVPDYNSVVDGEKVIKTALDNYGRIDILINNAGILRDKSFARISDQDWDLVHAVHLKGSFKTAQAAWPIFKKQGYGRIVMTSSNSGVYGNFGQANYSAAKMGAIGLASTIAIEGAKNNILCNVIVPTAASRLTEDILPPEMFAELKPELIAPVVAYLCHESCEDNGIVVESAVGWAGKLHMVRSPGAFVRSTIGADVSIEQVRDKWSEITDMSKAFRIETITEASTELMTSLQAFQDNQNSNSSDTASDQFQFCFKDLILYALGVGASVSDPSDLRFLYESHEDFGPLPTYFVLPSLMITMSSSIVRGAIKHKEVDFSNVLHGEQYLEILDELPQNGPVQTTCKVLDVLDKKSGAVVIVEGESFDPSGKLIVKAQCSTFVVGAGGFGGKRETNVAVQCVPAPNRKPDAVMQMKTSVDQAALYRLSGDLNPLHIDPNMALVSGFKQPILHGLCTLGFSVRAVLKQYADNNASLFRAVKVRFTKPVLPGQTLVVKMWQEKKRIHFETSILETGVAVITGAFVDLNEVIETTTKPPTTSTNTSTSGVGLKTDVIFQKIKEGVAARPELAKSINGVFLYNITNEGKTAKQWTVDLKQLRVYEGPADKGIKVDTTLTVSDDDFMEIALGKLNPQLAFMKGKLKITGNIMLTQKLAPLLKSEAKL